MTQRFALDFEDARLPLDRRFADRQPWILTTSAAQISIRPLRVELIAQRIENPVLISARFGEEDVAVTLSRDSLTLLCSRREPGLDWAGVNAQIKPLVLECILQDALAKLEEICGCVIEISDIEENQPPGHASNFACEIEVDGVVVSAGLMVPAKQLAKLQQWQHALPALTPPALNVPICIRRGTAILSREELRSLRIGDAIVLDACDQASSPFAVTGERFLAETQQQENGWRLLTPLLSFPTRSMRHLMSTSEDQDGSFPASESTVGDIPIRLVFDAGRIEVPLSELEGLGVGHVFDVGRHPSSNVDIVAQGRIIGRGEIITVEGLTAVRVTALNP